MMVRFNIPSTQEAEASLIEASLDLKTNNNKKILNKSHH